MLAFVIAALYYYIHYFLYRVQPMSCSYCGDQKDCQQHTVAIANEEQLLRFGIHTNIDNYTIISTIADHYNVAHKDNDSIACALVRIAEPLLTSLTANEVIKAIINRKQKRLGQLKQDAMKILENFNTDYVDTKKVTSLVERQWSSPVHMYSDDPVINELCLIAREHFEIKCLTQTVCESASATSVFCDNILARELINVENLKVDKEERYAITGLTRTDDSKVEQM
jgi:hypothetical protein